MKELSSNESYEQTDLPFYREHIAPLLPERVLDFHVHAWTNDQWKSLPCQADAAGTKYMVTEKNYCLEHLLADGRMLFPDRPFHAVCFGQPTPAVDIEKTNRYLAEAVPHRCPGELFPLLVTGRDTMAINELRTAIGDRGFFGYKVHLNWHGNDYGDISIEEMIGPKEMALADELRLIVMLHVPRVGRLTDREVQRGVRKYATEYPNAKFVLAHCGRCYHPDEMMVAIDAVADLPNVFFDTSMVMEPLVLQMAIETLGFRRILFGTDLPVAAMRGRRVYVMDHWVDVVRKGYPASDFRIASDNIHATFMAWEIVLAIGRAAKMAGLSEEQLKAIFFENGMSLIKSVRDGK